MTYKIRNYILGCMITYSVPILNIFRKGLPWSTSLDDLKDYPVRSWGREIHLFLSARQMSFLNKYEHHDALHVLLGYDTNVIGEAKLQAFMVGNMTPTFAGKCLYSIAQFLLPEDRKLFANERERGKQTPPIDWLAVEKNLIVDLDIVRKSWKIC